MVLRFGYGPITIQRLADEPRTWPELYTDALAEAQKAEELGFDSIWVGEHHFVNDGYLPAVFPMLAALAVRTDRVRLGTRVVLAPLHHPLRIAEDAAAVAILSGGRLILGLGVGYRREEFAAFGSRLRDRGKRLAETIDICRKAWTGLPFEHHGEYLSADGLAVRPEPGPIPIWLGGRADAALERAGRIADGFVAPVGPPDDLRVQLAKIDAAADAASRPRLPVCSSAYVALGTPLPTAIGRGIDALLAGYERLAGRDNPASRMGRASARSNSLAEGNAGDVARRLIELARAGGDREHHLTVRLSYPGMSRDEVDEHMGRFVEEVMPLVRASVLD